MKNKLFGCIQQAKKKKNFKQIWYIEQVNFDMIF